MRYLLLVTFFLVAFFVGKSFGQTRKCATVEINESAEKLNPSAQKAKADLESFTAEYLRNKTKSEEVYIIPVVFHVMHNYGAEDISRAQILDAIRILNDDFRKLNSDTSDIIPEFIGIAADSKIEFRLATIDPNGNCTDGIVRVVTTSTYYGDESTKLESPAWPRNKYLNIWTVESIANGAAGYSYYPSSVAGSWGEDVDGVMVLYNYVGSIWPSSLLTSRTLTHEIGHYLNLAHPWGSSNEPGLSSNCDIDDGVSDTPNTIGHTSCNLYAVSCGSLDNVQNYMEYSYCDRMFTEGQKQRMRAALNSSVSGRNNLWTLSNLISTGTDDGAVAAVCLPMPDFTFSKQFSCVNTSIQYTDLTWNSDTITSRNWSFPGGNPSTSTDLNPIVTYNNAGSYNVTLSVTNPAGSNQITRNDCIYIQDPTLGEALPFIEGFENNSFPIHPTDNSKNWTVIGDGISLWSRTAGISSSGSACVEYNNSNNIIGQTSTLLSPNILMIGNNPGNTIKFKVAYAQKDANSMDKLYVFISNNCGSTWALKYSSSGSSLSTNGGNFVNSFVPGPSDWRQESIFLNSLILNKPYIRIKFVATSGEGNSIFIDDINFDQATNIDNLSISERYNLSVFPNPVSNDSKIIFELEQRYKILFELVDIVGKQIATSGAFYEGGAHEVRINEIFNQKINAGIYFLKVSMNGISETIKITKD